MSLGDALTVIAVLAALLAVWYARATVLTARDSREDASSAHEQQMARQADLLKATRSVLETTRNAHEQEKITRADQLGRDLWLQRLTRLGRLQDLLGEAADIGRAEIEVPPPRIHGQPGTWTRVTGALLRVEAELEILELLGCEMPPDIRKTATECRRVGVEPGEVVSRTMSALQLVLHAAENDPAFRAPVASTLPDLESAGLGSERGSETTGVGSATPGGHETYFAPVSVRPRRFIDDSTNSPPRTGPVATDHRCRAASKMR